MSRHGAVADAARVVPGHPADLVRDVEAVDVQEIVQHPQVVTLQPLQREVHYEVVTLCPHPINTRQVLLRHPVT